MILKCTCAHEGQDLLNGKQNRVHNPNKDKSKYRCTICGAEHNGVEKAVKVTKPTK